MAKGKGLGRGLEAIFAEEVPAQNTPVGIRLSDIEPNPRQPRQDFEPVARPRPLCWMWTKTPPTLWRSLKTFSVRT